MKLNRGMVSAVMAVALAFGLCPGFAYASGPSDLATGTAAARGVAPQAMQVQAKKKLSSAKKKKVVAAYKKMLRQAKAKKGVFAGVSSYGTASYSLYDIGNDGVPELFVVGDYTGLAGFVEVYDYAAGKARDIGRVYTSDGWLYGTPKGKLYCACGRQGAYYLKSIKKASGKLKVKDPYKTFYAKDYNDWDRAAKRMDSWLSSRNAKALTTAYVTSYSLLNSKVKS